MAFKLKHSNVQLSGDKASPFKISNTLVQGAAIAAKGFTDVGAATNRGITGEVAPQIVQMVDPDNDTQSSLDKSKVKSCVEQGLTGQDLKACQDSKKEKDDLEEIEDEKVVEEEVVEEEVDKTGMLDRKAWKEGGGKESGSYGDYKKNYGIEEDKEI